jgi:hypothetical protein
MSRQQRYLARDHAELRPAAAARRRLGWRQARDDLGFGAAQVEIDRAPGAVVENDDPRLRLGPLDGERDIGRRPGCQPALAEKGREATLDGINSGSRVVK